MSEETARDERELDWLTGLLDHPDRGVAIAEARSDHEAGVRCEYLALAALLPGVLEPESPSAGLKERVVAAAREERLSRTTRAAAGEGRPRRSVWQLPLAAALALAATSAAVWQTARVGELRQRLEQQSEELSTAGRAIQRLSELEGRNENLAAAIALLTTAGVEFCPLRPPQTSPTPEAWGALAMSNDGERWYLRIVGLTPDPEEREYRLWFLASGEAIGGAVLASDRDGALELMAGEAPEGFDSIAITLEPIGSEQPSGPRLLYGNEKMQIL